MCRIPIPNEGRSVDVGEISIPKTSADIFHGWQSTHLGTLGVKHFLLQDEQGWAARRRVPQIDDGATQQTKLNSCRWFQRYSSSTCSGSPAFTQAMKLPLGTVGHYSSPEVLLNRCLRRPLEKHKRICRPHINTRPPAILCCSK